jgi:hypothetical protein
MTSSVALTIQHKIMGFVSDVESTWKEVAVAYSELLSQHLLTKSEEKQEISQSG